MLMKRSHGDVMSRFLRCCCRATFLAVDWAAGFQEKCVFIYLVEFPSFDFAGNGKRMGKGIYSLDFTHYLA